MPFQCQAMGRGATPMRPDGAPRGADQGTHAVGWGGNHVTTGAYVAPMLPESAPHYRVVDIGFAFVVAYQTTRGEPMAVSEHGDATSATQEARRLNLQRGAKPRARRPARSFDADTFA